eukprot:PhM_4_TR16177/c0_g2_i1/m.86730
MFRSSLFWRQQQQPRDPRLGHKAVSGDTVGGFSELVDEIDSEMRKNIERASPNKTLRTPLLGRWWVPYVCVLSFVFVWTPEKYKLALFQTLQWGHQALQFQVHRAYWRVTMDPNEYSMLMKQIADGVEKNKRVQSPDCPL